MKRALGAVTTWDTFKRMTEGAVDPVDFLNKQEPYINGDKPVEHHPVPLQYSRTNEASSQAKDSHDDVNFGSSSS